MMRPGDSRGCFREVTDGILHPGPTEEAGLCKHHTILWMMNQAAGRTGVPSGPAWLVSSVRATVGGDPDDRMTEGSSPPLAPRASADSPASLKVVVSRFIRPGTDEDIRYFPKDTQAVVGQAVPEASPSLATAFRGPRGRGNRPSASTSQCKAGRSDQTRSSLLDPVQRRLAMCDPEASNSRSRGAFKKCEWKRPGPTWLAESEAVGVRPGPL